MKERFVARLRAEVSGRYLSAAIASCTSLRVASLTFGSLLTTRETVLREVPAMRATSSIVARIMEGSFRFRMAFRIRSAAAVSAPVSGDSRRSPGPARPPLQPERSGDSFRCVACRHRHRFARPQRDVVVAPQDRQRRLAMRGPADGQVLEQGA